MIQSIAKMDNQTLREIRTVFKVQKFCFHYKLKKVDLIVLLSKQSTQ